MTQFILDFLEDIFGIEFVNKFTIKAGQAKRNAFTITILAFVDGIKKAWCQGGMVARAYIVMAPVLNYFLFSGLFSFVIVTVSNLFFIKYILSRK